MALKGNLQDFSLHQLLNLINLAHKTGQLTIAGTNGHSESAYLFFREGKLIHASFDNAPDRLTDMLVKVGKITPEQAGAVQERSRVNTDKELGLLLMQYGILSQTDIVQGVRSFLLDSIYQLFTWPSGNFRFEQNQIPSDERITVPLNLESVILEGARRQERFEALRRLVPDLDLPLKFAGKPNGNLRNISLSADEWKVISLINSRNTIRQIGQFLSLDEYGVRQVVGRLREAGLIELSEPEAAPPVPEPRRPAQPLPGAKVKRNIILRIIDGIRRR